MNIVTRAICIGALAALGGLIPWWLAQSFDELALLTLTLPATVIVAPIFMVVAIVYMSLRQRRRPVGAGEDSYQHRVRRHYLAWAALTVLAWIGLWVFSLFLASDLGVSGEGNWLAALGIVVPTLILGMIASAIVERVYERILEKRISKAH